LQEALATMNVGGDIFGSSRTHESLKKKLVEKDVNIIEIKHKLLETRKEQHLGCDNEIEKLKSQIVACSINLFLRQYHFCILRMKYN